MYLLSSYKDKGVVMLGPPKKRSEQPERKPKQVRQSSCLLGNKELQSVLCL